MPFTVTVVPPPVEPTDGVTPVTVGVGTGGGVASVPPSDAIAVV